MTTGNVVGSGPAKGLSADRFVEATLELIAAEGGSLGVNLRAVSRRVGCAHTNAYNYFDSYGDLLWAAFRRALRIYGEHLIHDLSSELPPTEYLHRALANLASFPQQNPGLYRFVGSDPIDVEDIPPDVMETVTAMKHWLAAAVEAASGRDASAATARASADIILAYIDGETLNLINGRAIGDEDLGARVLANAIRLFELLEGDSPRGRGRRRSRGSPPDPARIFGTATT